MALHPKTKAVKLLTFFAFLANFATHLHVEDIDISGPHAKVTYNFTGVFLTPNHKFT